MYIKLKINILMKIYIVFTICFSALSFCIGCGCRERRATSACIDDSPVVDESSVSDPLTTEIQDDQAQESHLAVDLGLPSGTKWAATNVGASNSYDPGDYFGFGEIKPSLEYTPAGYPEIPDCNLKGYAPYDAATANWGNHWEIPTYHEFDELNQNCVWFWTTINEKKGYRVIGANGNSIFLPAAGYKTSDIRDIITYSYNSIGYYRAIAGPKIKNEPPYIWPIIFSFSTECIHFDQHGPHDYQGASVRPVTHASYLDLKIDDNQIGYDSEYDEFSLARSGSIDGHEYVDLGLPSGLKWATLNIGASDYFDNGNGFFWAAIIPDDDAHSKDGNIFEYGDTTLNISGDPRYDAATAIWNGSWRLPSRKDFDELVENCKWGIAKWGDRSKPTMIIGIGPNKKYILFPCDVWTSQPGYNGYECFFDLSSARNPYVKHPTLEETFYNHHRKVLSIRPVSD